MDRRVAPAAAIVVMAGQKARSAVFAPAVPAIPVLPPPRSSFRDGLRGPDPESRYLNNIFFGFRVRSLPRAPV